MSSQERDDLLRRVTLGEIARDDARVRERAARDPEFERELAATLSIVDALERDGVIKEARAGQGAASVAREPAHSPMARRRWPWFAAGLAAAAVLLLVFRPRHAPREPGQGEVELGAGVHCVSPREGASTGYSVFRWTLGDTGVRTKIWILDASGRELAHPDVRDASEWQADAKATATWPDTIEWRIEVRDGEDGWVGADRTRASRD